MTATVPMRQLVAHAIGGGWGYEEPGESTEQVAIIRGADFPAVVVGDSSSVPVRWEERKKLPARLLQPNDIVLEISGGTSDRPTGRTIFATSRLLERIGKPTIPASFCRLVRIDPSQADPHYVYWWLQGMYADGRTWSYQNRSTGIANFQFEHFLDTEVVALPSRAEQRAISATLGALDDKIESNHRVRGLLREVGKAELAHALAIAGPNPQALKALTRSIARGVAPKYADDDPSAPLVVNQRCVRGGWVALAPARRMVAREVPVAKKAYPGDVLVNSTGVGTLGRVGRWHEGEVFVDSHVSVVKPDPDSVDPAVLAYALLDRESAIERLSTGSTGQTELSPARLGELQVTVPDWEHSRALGSALIDIENCVHQLAVENDRLAALRDALLPELLSGRIRVPSEAAA